MKGAIEGEDLKDSAKASAGEISIQNMDVFGEDWSGGSQLFWTPREANAELTIVLPAPAEKPEATMSPSRLMSAQRNGWWAELADHCHRFESSVGVVATPPGGSRPDVGTRWQIVGAVDAAEAGSALGTSTTANAATSAPKRLHLRSEGSGDMGGLLSSGARP